MNGPLHRLAAALIVSTLTAGLALPVFAADGRKKKDDSSKNDGKGDSKKGKGNRDDDQSDDARKSIDKQKDIAAGLKDRALSDPATLQAMIDDLKKQLQDETDRHNAAVDANNAEQKAVAGDKKRLAKAQKSANEENKAYQAKKDKLEKQIAALQAKLDAAGGSPTTVPAPTPAPGDASRGGNAGGAPPPPTPPPAPVPPPQPTPPNR